jgi:hypothetical protein
VTAKNAIREDILGGGDVILHSNILSSDDA